MTASVSNAVNDEAIFHNGRPRPEESACPAGREVLPPFSGILSLYAGAPQDENGPVAVLTRPGDRLRLLGSSLGALAVVEVGLAIAQTGRGALE